MRRNRKHQRRSGIELRTPAKRNQQTANSRQNKSASKRTSVNITKKSASKAPDNKKTVVNKFIYSFFACLFVVLVACLGVGAGMYAAITQEISEMNVHELALTSSSIVYYTDKDGNSVETATLFNDGNRVWIESPEISDIMKEAIVAIEDERFYKHSGVDIKRTTGAIFGYIGELFGQGSATYGGSTITQQVIKNITQEKDRTATRKIKEMMRAVAIEKELSKDEILTIYLNVIFLANNCYGVEAASNMYFDKSASELELHEAALIAGITQRPSYYDPLRNPENALKKRNTVLLKMYELEKITKEEYDAAVNMDIDLKGAHKQGRNKVYSYFVDHVINEVIKDLQIEKGYTETFATQQVYGGGLKIYTTMDYDIQSAIEGVFENNSNFPSGAKNAQASMIIIDPQTGEIKGMVGGKGEKTASRGLNRATQTTRQPGSSIKPLSVYGPAIDKGVVTPSTVLLDAPITIKDWAPKNSYTGFKGNMTVKKAIAISANIPSIKTLQKLGISTSYDYAKNKFMLSTLVDADKDLSPLSLGGLTNGVTVCDMAAAYAVFANGGYYIEPFSYTKVLDSTNRVLLENNDITKTRVIKASTASLMSNMLYGVVNSSGGTGRLARLSNMPAYGKTGTTNNDYDKWFVGYTKYYVGAVWFGFDTPSSIRRAGIYNNISASLWKKVMEEVHQGLPSEEIDVTQGLSRAYICSVTGNLATDGCDGSWQYFEKGSAPDIYCSGIHETGLPEEPEETETPEESPTDTPPTDSGAIDLSRPTDTPSEDVEQTPPSLEQTPPADDTPQETPPADDGTISLE